jgi:hypothetical protein
MRRWPIAPSHVTLPAVFAVGGLLVACRRPVTHQQCAEMLDKYVDMTLMADPKTRDLPPAQAAAAREMKKAVKKAEPVYAKAEKQCATEVSRSEYACAMDAKNADEWEACIE